MAPRLAEIAQRLVTQDGETKGQTNYELYDRYFGEFADQPVTLLELGVHRADSTKVFASYFKNGKVIGVDLNPPAGDFSDYPNIILERADQGDAARLRDICGQHASAGLDLVIDDAAHVGFLSLASYRALLPLLKPGGLYVVEDWGTGYWNDWLDGQEFRESDVGWVEGGVRRRIRSHDFGMVGFLKSVFEDISFDIAATRAGQRTRTPTLEFLHVYGNIAIMKKRRS